MGGNRGTCEEKGVAQVTPKSLSSPATNHLAPTLAELAVAARPRTPYNLGSVPVLSRVRSLSRYPQPDPQTMSWRCRHNRHGRACTCLSCGCACHGTRP